MTYAPPPVDFDPQFRSTLAHLFAWRRDVRRFRADAVPDALVARLLDLMQLSPSVGNSQPWRWVRVDDPARRAAIHTAFARCNRQAHADQPQDRQAPYAALKLEGLGQAPVQFAIFCDETTDQGHGLGRATMPETLAYSVVGAITTFWLAARAEGLGVGWLSILPPHDVHALLDVPLAWRFVAWLCVGWPQEAHRDPELERYGWQARTGAGRTILQR